MHTTINVSYTFVAVKDGSSHLCALSGEAADSGDKGVAKALSMAFKYLIFQAFAVPTEGQGHDPDAETVEFKGKSKDRGAEQMSQAEATSAPAITEDQRQTLIPLLTEAKVDVQTFLKHYKVGALSALPASEFDSVLATLNKRVGEARADRVLTGNASAPTEGSAKPQPVETGASESAGDSPAGGKAQPDKAKLGPKVSRFRGVR